jgi:hypothetical protein
MFSISKGELDVCFSLLFAGVAVWVAVQANAVQQCLMR